MRASPRNHRMNNDKINHKETQLLSHVTTILTYLTFDKDANNCEKLSVSR